MKKELVDLKEYLNQTMDIEKARLFVSNFKNYEAIFPKDVLTKAVSNFRVTDFATFKAIEVQHSRYYEERYPRYSQEHLEYFSDYITKNGWNPLQALHITLSISHRGDREGTATKVTILKRSAARIIGWWSSTAGRTPRHRSQSGDRARPCPRARPQRSRSQGSQHPCRRCTRARRRSCR